MSLIFDHVVLLVKDLKQASSDFTKLGFTVTPGGTHYRGLSENALIFFADGSFVELFALKPGLPLTILKLLHGSKIFKRWQYSPKYGIAHRFYARALELAEGVTDYCLLSDQLQQDYKRIESNGIFMTRPLTAGRKKTDGSAVEWDMCTPYIADLPFLRSDYAPKKPIASELTIHQNKAQGISAIHHLALDYKDCVQKYEQLLGISPESTTMEKAIFAQNDFKFIVYRTTKNYEAQKMLSGRGIGLYGFTLKGSNAAQNFDQSLLHGLTFLDI